MTRTTVAVAIALSAAFVHEAAGRDFVQFGDADVLGTGVYSGDPMAGATVAGLLPGAVTHATLITPHGFPFDPGAGDYPGTDQIYAGSQQAGAHDGYSQYAGRLQGPQVITMDYSSIAPAGLAIATLTLGIAADDFQNGEFGQPFVAQINGAPFQPLTDALNSLNQTGPRVQYLSVGLPISLVNAPRTLTLSIDGLGDGGDGWAIDFLTIGVTPVPAPSGLAVVSMLGLACGSRRRP